MYRPPRTDVLTTVQVAALLGRSQDTVARMVDRGVFPCERTPGGHRRIPREAVEAYRRGERYVPASVAA